MAYDEEPGTIRDMFVVERPVGTSLSDSSSPGGISALLRDAANVLAGHAVLYPADAELDDLKAEAREEGRQEGVVKGVVIGVVATTAVAVLGAVAVKAAPHIKSKFNDFRSKLNRKTEVAEPAPLRAAPEPTTTADKEVPSRSRHLHVAWRPPASVRTLHSAHRRMVLELPGRPTPTRTLRSRAACTPQGARPRS
ncbi:hypothetical protein ACFZCF_31450 [Streptomyces sp. NPDC007945]|uniref:hypothetical protein n=1 Tax=Streptomyces sp. NPDC007945 TaxID=3364797 RepID=UPI0036E45F68